MWRLWCVLLISLSSLNNFCAAVKCADVEVLKFKKGTVRNTTCEGDVCMNFYYKRFKQVDKTCITTEALKIQNGCTQFDRLSKELIVCFCNTDFCNSGDVSGTPTILSEYNCSSSLPGSAATYILAPLCTIDVVDKKGKRTMLQYALTGFEETFPVPVTRTAPLETFSIHDNIVHTISGIQKDITKHHYKCRGNHCNKKISSKFASKSDVTCTSTEGTNCKGEFCVFATNGTSMMYCLSTEVITGNNQYEIGVFRYKNANFYLCKEDYCNTDEETAKKSIAVNRAQLDDGKGEGKNGTTEETIAIAGFGPQLSGKEDEYNCIFLIVAVLSFIVHN